MPETIILEDGTEREVPTKEEMESLQASADKVKEFSDQIEELEAGTNPNWPEIRQKLKKLDALEASGKEIGDEGEIKEKNIPFSQEDAQKISEQTTHKMIMKEKVNTYLASIPEEKRQTVEETYNKLTVGQEVNSQNMDDFMTMAKGAVGITDSNLAHKLNSPAHGSTNLPSSQVTDNYAESDSGKDMGKKMGLKYANIKDK